MAVQAELARERERYARETEHRMKSFTEELHAFVLTQTGCTHELRSQLRQQEEASRRTGFIGIARLCRQMQDCLMEAEESGPTQSAAAAGWLLGVCRAIQAHAHDAEKLMRRLNKDNECGEGRPMPNNEATPLAAISAQCSPGDCCLVEAN